MKLIYVAGKYRAKTEFEIKRNIDLACYYQEEITKLRPDLFVVCPHKNTAYLGGIRDDKYFIDGTLELLRRCDYIYMLPGWEDSEGARGEKAEADRLGIKDLTEEIEV